MIEGSFKNMLALLKFYRKKGKCLNLQINKLESCLENLKLICSIEQLLLLEAKAKQIYYSSFDVILENENIKFEKRTKNPPMNEVNAILSYGYALLYSIILAVLDRSSLHPQISFIHSLSKNCDSLQFDIADIFKPVIVDRLMLRLIRKKQIKKEHFDFKENDRCFLNQSGISVVVNAFDETIKSTVLYNGKSYSYKSLISKEIHHLSNYIKDERKLYKAFTMKW